MALTEIVAAVRENLAAVVFVNVLLQQLGLPVPVVPTLLLAGVLRWGGLRWVRAWHWP